MHSDTISQIGILGIGYAGPEWHELVRAHGCRTAMCHYRGDKP